MCARSSGVGWRRVPHTTLPSASATMPSSSSRSRRSSGSSTPSSRPSAQIEPTKPAVFHRRNHHPTRAPAIPLRHVLPLPFHAEQHSFTSPPRRSHTGAAEALVQRGHEHRVLLHGPHVSVVVYSLLQHRLSLLPRTD